MTKEILPYSYLISRIWNMNTSRALIFAILQKNKINKFRAFNFADSIQERMTSWSLAQSLVTCPERSLGTRFFLLRGGVAVAEVINTTHRRSPLVQGRLEIPVKIAVEIELTAKNRLIIDKYKELVLANYKEPDLSGHFDDCTKDVLKELHVQEDKMSDSDEESAEVDDK